MQDRTASRLRVAIARIPGRVIREGLSVAVLIGIALWYGTFAYRHSPEPPSFYQKDFGPAVMVALGGAFERPLPAPGSPLDDFLRQRRRSLSPDDALPRCAPQVRESFPRCVATPDQLQFATRYLMLAIAAWWRIAGISWDSVAPMAGALHALAVVAAYAFFRLWLPLTPAAAGAVLISVSPVQLTFVPHIRDHSKGAFILAALPLLVVLALKPLPRWRLAGVAAAAGVALGIGFGFKMDVAIMVPLTLLFLVLFRGAFPWSALPEKLLLASVFLTAFVVAAGPVLFSLSRGGSNLLHVILLGYADPFDTALGVEPSVYRFVPHYEDLYLNSMLRAREAATTGRWLEFPSPEYDNRGRELLTDIVRNFPADVLARTLAAAEGILNLSFTQPQLVYRGAPLPFNAQWERAGEALNTWRGWGAALGVTLVGLAMVCRGPREGTFAALLLLALAGYPSLQFHPRNYFHLQFISVLAIAAPLSVAGSIAVATLAYRSRWPGLPRARAATRAALIRAAGALMLMGLLTMPALVLLRAYQSKHLQEGFEAFLARPRTRLDVEFVPRGDHLWLARWPDVAGIASSAGPLKSAYYIAEFQSDAPRGLLAAVALRYRSPNLYPDYSRVVSVASGTGLVRLGFPVYSQPPSWEFEGLELGNELRRRLVGIYRVDAVGPLDLPIELRLPANWGDLPLFQRLARERRPDLQTAETRIAAPGITWATQVAVLDSLAGSSPALDVAAVHRVYSPQLTVQDGQIAMEGIAETQSAYLVEFKPMLATADAVLFAQGRLETGGVAIGLLQNNAWSAQVVVNHPGDFVAIVPVAGANTYVPIVTNALAMGERQNRFVITRLGMVDRGAEHR